MSIKKPHQHFIPKCYLKNFGFTENSDKTFVYAKLRNEEINKYSIKDICVEKNLYTLPIDDEKADKFFLENFYAENIDSAYPEIYSLLTDDTITEIDEKTREKIIFVCLSLYFRTPKYLHLQNDMLEEALVFLEDAKRNNSFVKTFLFQGRKFDLSKHSVEEIRTELRKENKLRFLLGHLDIFQEFIVFIKHHAIGVNKLVDDSELITCDNPVNISNSLSRGFNLFDPKNTIKFPLNSKYYLCIIPNWTNDNLNYIFRTQVAFDFTLTTNLDTQKNAENWLIGSKNSLKNHFTDQQEHKNFTPENIKWLNEVKQRAFLMKDAVELFEKYGLGHPLSLRRIQELKKNPIIFKEPQFQDLLKSMREKNYHV